jgi:hypothetical protein
MTRQICAFAAVLCCAVQVPHQLAAAFVSAAQHSWQSPATRAAIAAFSVLLDHAAAAGFMKDGCATGSLGNAIKQ